MIKLNESNRHSEGVSCDFQLELYPGLFQTYGITRHADNLTSLRQSPKFSQTVLRQETSNAARHAIRREHVDGHAKPWSTWNAHWGH